MNIITAICLVCCVFIFCLFTFFTIVYISELKREKAIRKLMLDANDKMQNALNAGQLPVIMVDLPIKQDTPLTPSTNKDKKIVN